VTVNVPINCNKISNGVLFTDIDLPCELDATLSLPDRGPNGGSMHLCWT